jgi:hypothetical protein
MTSSAQNKNFARIRFAGDCLELEVPAAEGEQSHTLRFDLEHCSVIFNEFGTSPIAANRGWYALLEILKARYSAEHAEGRCAIGMKSAPVQYDLEHIMKTFPIKKVGKKRRIVPEATLEDLDL